MKKLISLFCVLAAVAVFLPAAHATTITFDDLASTYGYDSGTTYTESGYTFTGSFLYSYGSEDTYAYTGSAALSDDYGAAITLTATDGSLFDLTSIELSEIYADDPYETTVVITGITSDGGEVSYEYTTDGTFGMETVLLSDEFTGLVSVTISGVDIEEGEYFQIDDVTVNTSEVPLPAAFLLLGSGLPLLISARRRNA